MQYELLVISSIHTITTDILYFNFTFNEWVVAEMMKSLKLLGNGIGFLKQSVDNGIGFLKQLVDNDIEFLKWSLDNDIEFLK